MAHAGNAGGPSRSRRSTLAPAPRRQSTLSVPASYPRQLRAAMSRFLPRQGLRLVPNHARERWTPRLLVVCMLLMVFSSAQHLQDRFAQARGTLLGMYPTRRRPGESYQGFITALSRISQRLLETVCQTLRRHVKQLAGPHWTVRGWVLFGVDSSRFDLPMTEAHEHVHGVGSRKNSGPQMLLTMLFHVGTGLPWSFVREGVLGSERHHLLQMLPWLPKKAMLIADAGFTGYELLQALIHRPMGFVIRVGSNVSLLRKLGYAVREQEGIVYLWPEKQRKKGLKPLVLRLIELSDGRNRKMYLLTNVLQREQLSEAAAAELYRLRWGIELIWRSIKQTLSRRKLLSDSPRNAEVELEWCVVGFWLLGLMSVQQLLEAGQLPGSWGVAASLRVVREALAAPGPRRGRTPLRHRLSAAGKDRYVRHRSKKARHWPHKKREKPPGAPKARNATEAEVQLAQQLREARPPGSLAA